MERKSEMILLSADLRHVLARLAHRHRSEHASEAHKDERLIRIQEAAGSIPASGSR